MAAKTASDTIVGVFETQSEAVMAIVNLKAVGFEADQIGCISRNADGEIRKSGTQKDDGATETGAISGAAVGALGGAAVGAGIITGVIPVIGPILAIGTLGTILANAAGGAAAVGLAGALAGWGLSDDDASHYEKEVQSGKHLVTVKPGTRGDDARRILDAARGFDRSGWKNAPMGV